MEKESTWNASAVKLTWLCVAAYFCSYITRLNYGAVMIEMIAKEGFSRSGASAAVTGLFITYGIGQVISGFLGDRLRPQMLIFYGLLVSAAMNLLIPVCPNTALMTVVWCINGFAQALMWPPIVRILSVRMSADVYKRSVIRVGWGSSFGTIFVYLIAPVFVSLSGWKLIFLCSALVAIGFAFFWLFAYRRLEKEMDAAPAEKAAETAMPSSGAAAISGKAFTAPVCLMLAIVMLAIIMQGMLRDGITTWMPSYISDTFDLGSAVSILTGVILPVFAILSIYAVALVNRKLIQNELLCAGAFFAVGLGSMIALYYTTSVVSVSVLAFALGSACMHGVNTMLISMLPKYFQYTGKISLVSGVLNACTYVGSALSTYGIAVVTDHFGWSRTVLIWILAALIGTVLCLAATGSWKRFKNQVPDRL